MALAITFVSAVAFLFFCLWLVSRSRAKDAVHQRNTLEMQRDNVEAQNAAILANNERLTQENTNLRNMLTPLPTAKEETPGLQAAMQAVVDEAKADAPQSIHRLHEGDRKFPHVGHADVIVEDGRPDVRMEEQAKIDDLARTLQGTTANRSPTEFEKMYGGKVMTTSPEYRGKLDAQIRKEALEEAVALLPPEKVAELRAEGGDAAVEAYVAPVVEQTMAALSAASATDAETLLASPQNVRSTWVPGEPRRAASSLASNLEANRRLTRGLLGPLPGGEIPQAKSPTDQPPTDEVKALPDPVASN